MITLHIWPRSPWGAKVLHAAYEKELVFERVLVIPLDPVAAERSRHLTPFGTNPVLVENGNIVFESTIICEYLDLHHRGGVRLLPDDPLEALEARFLDRFAENYIVSAGHALYWEGRKRPQDRSLERIRDRRAQLDTAWSFWNERIQGRPFAAGRAFSIADLCAGTALIIAHQHGWRPPAGLANVERWLDILRERPAWRRAFAEMNGDFAQPWLRPFEGANPFSGSF